MSDSWEILKKYNIGNTLSSFASIILLVGFESGHPVFSMGQDQASNLNNQYLL